MESEELKEVADIARNQVLELESARLAGTIELDSLRSQVLDLQAQTDDKTVIAKLHRSIVGLQLKVPHTSNPTSN